MPEIILLITFFFAAIIQWLIYKKYKIALSGRIAMAAMLVSTGIAHFVYTDGMILMLPDFIPYRLELVYLTGIIEILAAVGLLVPKYQKLTAWLLILFFVMVISSNIYATMNHVNLRTATFDGNGPSYLWYRIPLQMFFIIWVYLSAIKLNIGNQDR